MKKSLLFLFYLSSLFADTNPPRLQSGERTVIIENQTGIDLKFTGLSFMPGNMTLHPLHAKFYGEISLWTPQLYRICPANPDYESSIENTSIYITRQKKLTIILKPDPKLRKLALIVKEK